MESPRLVLLGLIELSGAPGADELLAQSKLVALLAYLALGTPSGYVRRDRILAVLWPELESGHARSALRKALHELRHLVGEHVIETRGDEDVALAPAALWCDAVAFGAAEADARLADALDCYRGELMPGFHMSGCLEYDQWLEQQRASLRERAGSIAWALAIQHEREHSLTSAGSLARRAVRLLDSNERVLRRALELLDRIGDRAAAMTLYEEFAKRLRQDLDMEPSLETRQLAERLRTAQKP
ncbi:MAG: BTAD domain-containing putative transcriptional regulator [Gemmatimonadales bacterium]